MKSYEKEYRHCLENSNKMELVDKIIYDEKEIERLNNIIKQKEQIINIKDINETIAWEEVVKLRKVIEELQKTQRS